MREEIEKLIRQYREEVAYLDSIGSDQGRVYEKVIGDLEKLLGE